MVTGGSITVGDERYVVQLINDVWRVPELAGDSRCRRDFASLAVVIAGPGLLSSDCVSAGAIRSGRPDRRALRLLLVVVVIGELLALPPFCSLAHWPWKPVFGQRHRVVVVVLSLQLLAILLGVFPVRLNRRFALSAAGRLRDRFFAHVLFLPTVIS